MFERSTYSSRRHQLIQSLEGGIALFLGNELSSMNYHDNHYHFRQDSSFLYYFGIDQPHLAAIVDIDAGHSTLFGDDPSVEMIVWTGPQVALKELAIKVGIENTSSYNKLFEYIQQAQQANRKIHILPPYRPENKILLAQCLNTSLEGIANWVSRPLIETVVKQRSIKEANEIVQMEEAVNLSAQMHLNTIQKAKPGLIESQLAGQTKGIALSGGGQLSYPIIMTINGQTLHNHYHGNELQSGQLLLGDYGAENAMHYAGDITRTIPIDATFTDRQKEIYEIVLAAEQEVIDVLRPNITYLDMHKKAAGIITEGLKALGLMKGDTQEAVEQGAHALFFPHGLGHMIGLDVHDMEDLGEDLVGYDEEIQRSPLFGYKSLRLGRRLQAGFVLTVEPGIYFIPELVQQWQKEQKFKSFINYQAVKKYLNFGGIRIEDNVLITSDGHRVLGNPIPKTVAEIEAIRMS